MSLFRMVTAAVALLILPMPATAWCGKGGCSSTTATTSTTVSTTSSSTTSTSTVSTSAVLATSAPAGSVVHYSDDERDEANTTSWLVGSMVCLGVLLCGLCLVIFSCCHQFSEEPIPLPSRSEAVAKQSEPTPKMNEVVPVPHTGGRAHVIPTGPSEGVWEDDGVRSELSRDSQCTILTIGLHHAVSDRDGQPDAVGHIKTILPGKRTPGSDMGGEPNSVVKNLTVPMPSPAAEKMASSPSRFRAIRSAPIAGAGGGNLTGVPNQSGPEPSAKRHRLGAASARAARSTKPSNSLPPRALTSLTKQQSRKSSVAKKRQVKSGDKS